MVKVTEGCFEATGHTSIICDFSPPRSGDPGVVDQAQIDADFISVAYNPGRAVRTNSAMLAAAIQRSGKDTVFTLATRDMNKLALQSQLLGAQILGVRNVVVVQGDPFNERDRERVASVNDYQPTGLIAAIAQMNQGLDFREGKLRTPADICIGATVDLGRGIEEEAQLAVRKVRAGAEFLITQPIFNVDHVARYRESYAYHAGKAGTLPIYFGLQILEQDGVLFSSVPESVRTELEGGRSGVDIALELYQKFQEARLNNIYLMPPIKRGGARNYEAAKEFLSKAVKL
ncbi:MAG: methylenetetrahydrofolate reductase [Chloroflexi bacterium]|nr:methylenetetrahydrofolate reductase [Chloroflexota bacterium]MCH8892273.1 methylenetetrahydrofolate reductase [Chloroflexota bacterium]MCI0788428.1 methylenetetrahydrofolate reductase [Chloroflexota bacterium]MCI0810576.1 methylenetetrahydrofolate reductase [Chloroflexota bacterium]MCI0829264.1 methylenetetrahydrofolate reductase [Chloroflexota bacterium]